jgi:hypothetical protein
MTLGLFAAVVWLFTTDRPADRTPGVRWLARYTAAAIGCYPITFFLFYPGGPLGSGAALGVFGTLALIGIVWMLSWTVRAAQGVHLTVARLAALAALVNLTLGAVLGVLVEARFAGVPFPGNVNAAHPAMMTVGYLLPAAFMFIEWHLGTGIDGRRGVAGAVSVALLLVGGWLAMAAAVLNVPELFPPILLMQVAAVLIMAVRMAGKVVRARWLSAVGERHAAVAAIAVAFDVALLFYAVSAYFAVNLEPPRTLFVAISHTEFVGIMTNAVFATLLLATAPGRETVWPWADHVVFWGTNVGWVGFALAELLGALALVPIVTPVMGVSLLLGVATYAMRLRGAEAPRLASLAQSS